MVFSRGLTGLPAIFEYCQVCHWPILCHFITILLSWFGCPFSCFAFLLLLQFLKEKREQKHKRFWFVPSNSSCLIFRMLQQENRGHKSCQWPNHSIILNQTTYQPYDFIDTHSNIYFSDICFIDIHLIDVRFSPTPRNPSPHQATDPPTIIHRKVDGRRKVEPPCASMAPWSWQEVVVRWIQKTAKVVVVELLVLLVLFLFVCLFFGLTSFLFNVPRIPESLVGVRSFGGQIGFFFER